MNKKKGNMLLALLFVAGSAHAQLYKCVVNGKPLFSERPCAPNAQLIDTGDGSISYDRQLQAAEVANRERRLAQSSGAMPLDRKRMEQTSQPSAKDSKQAKCDNLLKVARDAKNESKMYRYHQGLIDDAKRREKEAKDAHFSECYGSNLVPYSPPD